MFIRSQNKKLLVNMDAVAEITVREDIIGAGMIGGGVNGIGSYSTKEKAAMVLNMIQVAVENGKKTFQMPQDDEVDGV